MSRTTGAILGRGWPGGRWPSSRPAVRYLLLAAGALVIGGVGCTVGIPGWFGARSAVRPATAEITQGKITASISAAGTVASPAQAKLAFRVGGRLKQVLVVTGQQVEAGQPLAELDAAELRSAVAQAQAALNGARAKLEQAKAGSRPEELDALQAQVDAATVKLNEARAAAQGPEITGAQSQFASAQIRLRQVTAGGRAEDLAAAQAQLDAANSRLAALLNPRAEDLAAAQTQLVSAVAKLNGLTDPRVQDLAAAQAQLDAANSRLAALLNPRAEDVKAAEAQVESAKVKLLQLQTPRPEDVRGAEAALAAANAKLQALSNPRPEDIAAAVAALEQQRIKLSAMVEKPRTATTEDLANADLAIQRAQLALDKALADAADPEQAGLGGFGISQQQADNAVRTARLNLETAQNNQRKLAEAGPDESQVKLQQQALAQAQANLDKLKSASPADVQAAQAAVAQAQATLDKLKNPAFLDLKAAQQAVTQAQANLDKLKSPSSADVQAAQAAVAQAQATFDRLRTPADPDLQAAQQAVAQAQANLERLRNPSAADVQAAQAAVAQAQATLDKLRLPSDPDVQAAQQAVTQAQANVDRLRSATTYAAQAAQAQLRQAQAQLEAKQSGATTYDLAVATAAVEQAQAQLEQAQANLGTATLTAPFSGTVGSINASPGEVVSPATVVITLVDARQIRVDVSIDEADIAKLYAGQPVVLTFDAIPGKQVPGRVDVIAPIAAIQQGIVTYQAQIQVEAANAQGVRPGMSATANIVTEEKESTVLVPTRALLVRDKESIVEVLEPDGKITPRPVKTGIYNDDFTEILDGLRPGERAILPQTSIAPPIGRPLRDGI